MLDPHDRSVHGFDRAQFARADCRRRFKRAGFVCQSFVGH